MNSLLASSSGEERIEDVDPIISRDSFSVSSELKDIDSCSSKAAPTKRPLDNSERGKNDDTHKKKEKMETVLGGNFDDENVKESREKTFLERLSSDIETEIRFFNCMLAFHSEQRNYPFSDSTKFDYFCKNWFIEDTPASLLVEAIKGLKKKHQKLAVKIGGNLCLLGPRELKAFELAKKIWNDIGTSPETDEYSNDGKMNEDFLLLSKYPYLKESLKFKSSISRESIMNGLGSIGHSKMEELDDKWKKFWDEQMQLTFEQNELDLNQEELCLKKKELISKQEKLLTDAIQSSSSPKTPTD